MSHPPPQYPNPGTGRIQQTGLAVLGLAMAALGIYILQGFIRPLVWAVIFAVAVQPLYSRAERRWPPARYGILLPALGTLVVALIFLTPLVALGIQIGKEVTSLVKALLEYQTTGIPVPDFVANLPFAGQAAADWWQTNLSDPASVSTTLGRINREQLLAFSGTFGTQVLRRMVSFVFTIVTLFFLFRDGDILGRQLQRGVIRAFGSRGGAVGAQIVASVRGTVAGLVLVGIGEGLLLGIAYLFAGVPHPTLFGTITAVAAMVPFGAPLVFGIAALILLAQAAVTAAVAIFVFGFVVVFVADHLIRPLLIGGATRLPFIWVLLGILGGVETFGVIGLFLGPAVMSALILLWREWVGEPMADVQSTGS